MADREVILKNFEEYKEMAEYSFSKEKFNSAVTLYYKALVELCDLELLSKLNKIGANHTERFELLREANFTLYNTASKLFRFYRDSYSKEITFIVAKIVKKEVEDAERAVLS